VEVLNGQIMNYQHLYYHTRVQSLYLHNCLLANISMNNNNSKSLNNGLLLTIYACACQIEWECGHGLESIPITIWSLLGY